VSDVLPLPRIVPLAVVAFALSQPACGGATTEQVALSSAVVAANTTRLAVQSAETGALALYRAEQVAVVERVKAQNGTRDMAVAAVEAVRAKWKPVWSVIDAAAAAHTALVAAIGAYETGKRTAAEVAGAVTALAAAEQEVVAAVALVRGER